MAHTNIDMDTSICVNVKNEEKDETTIQSTNQTTEQETNMKNNPKLKNSFDYSTVPDEVFMQMITTAFDGTANLTGFSNEADKIKFVRQYTILIDRLFYLQLQEFQWKYYEDIWQGHMEKDLAEKYAIDNSIYYRSERLVTRSIRKISAAILQVEEELHSNSSFTSFPIAKLSSLVYDFVEDKQKPLQDEFRYQRSILRLDSKDHQLVHKFLNLKPNEFESDIAARIWQATKRQMSIEEDIILLEYRLTSTRIQLGSHLIYHMIDDIDKNITNLKQSLVVSANEIEKLEDLKRDIIRQAITTSRKIVAYWDTRINKQQNKFKMANQLPDRAKIVFDTIEIRRLHMRERAQFIIEHKLT